MVETSITFTDLSILREILSYTKFNGNPPPITTILQNVNDFIERNHIPESHITPISRYRLQQLLEKLRSFGLLETGGKYQLTEAGFSFSLRYANMPWMGWPIYIPMVNNLPRFDKAFYLKEN